MLTILHHRNNTLLLNDNSQLKPTKNVLYFPIVTSEYQYFYIEQKLNFNCFLLFSLDNQQLQKLEVENLY